MASGGHVLGSADPGQEGQVGIAVTEEPRAADGLEIGESSQIFPEEGKPEAVVQVVDRVGVVPADDEPLLEFSPRGKADRCQFPDRQLDQLGIVRPPLCPARPRRRNGRFLTGRKRRPGPLVRPR